MLRPLARPSAGDKLVEVLPMARKQVVEIKCDRCKRAEYKDPEGASEKKPLLILWLGTEIRYEDLCSPCAATVSRNIEQISKTLEGKSPKRETKKGESAEAPSPISDEEIIEEGPVEDPVVVLLDERAPSRTSRPKVR